MSHDSILSMKSLCLRLLSLCVFVGLLPGCALRQTGTEIERVSALEERVESLAQQDLLEEAEELAHEVLESLEKDLSAKARAEFVLGWVLFERSRAVASSDQRDPPMLQEQSADRYQRALGFDPGFVDARVNLSFVRTALGEFDAAISLLSEGIERLEQSSDPKGSEDRRRLRVQLTLTERVRYQELAKPEESDSRRLVQTALSAFIDEDALRSSKDLVEVVALVPASAAELVVDEKLIAVAEIARRGKDPGVEASALAELIRRNGRDSESELLRWVEVISSELMPGSFSESLGGLLDLKALERHPALAAWKAVDELRQLVGEVPDLSESSFDGFWVVSAQTVAKETSLRRHQALSLALLARAAELTESTTDEEDLDKLAAVESFCSDALSLVPTTETYRDNPAIRPDVRFQLAAELAMFYGAHRELIPAYDRGLSALLEADGELGQNTFAAFERSPAERLKYYGVVGVLKSLNIKEGDEATQLLVAHLLRMAIDAARESTPPRRPDPRLALELSELQRKLQRPNPAVAALREAAEAYLALEAPEAARETLPKAYEVADFARSRLDTQIFELENLLYPPHGFYVGVSGGITLNHKSSEDIEGGLDDKNHTSVDVEGLETIDFAGKGFLGWRFDAPVSIEAGYVAVGGPDSSVTADPDSRLAKSVEDAHPLAGHGPTASFVVHPYEHQRFSTLLRAGIWYWRANTDVIVNGEKLKVRDTGLDPFCGAGLQYRFTPDIYGRFEFERYFFRGRFDWDEGTDVISFGIFYLF